MPLFDKDDRRRDGVWWRVVFIRVVVDSDAITRDRRGVHHDPTFLKTGGHLLGLRPRFSNRECS